jgi:hypothetical protein
MYLVIYLQIAMILCEFLVVLHIPNLVQEFKKLHVCIKKHFFVKLRQMFLWNNLLIKVVWIESQIFTWTQEALMQVSSNLN